MSSATVTPPPTGVFVPVPTFLHPASSSSSSSSSAVGSSKFQPAVDIETQTKHAIFLSDAGCAGVVLLGSTGEAIHLTRQERADLVGGVRRGLDAAGHSNFPIMAGVLSSGGVDEALEWLADYAAAGAQWGLVLVPGYFGVSANQENIKEWYTIVADNSPIPILVYNYPGVTNNVVVAPDTYRALAAHPNIVGCKMSHGNVSHHIQVSADPQIDASHFRVYSGFGQQLGPIVLFGAAGVIDGMSAYYPKTVVRLMNLCNAHLESPSADTLKEMRRLQWAVSRAEEFLGRTGIVGIKEAVQRITGMGNLEGGRLPLRGKLAEGEFEKLRAELMAPIEEIEKSL